MGTFMVVVPLVCEDIVHYRRGNVSHCSLDTMSRISSGGFRHLDKFSLQ